MAELSPKQQVVEFLKNNSNFLILTHKNPDGDALGSALALQETLTRLKKESVIVCKDIIPQVFDFIAGINEIKRDFQSQKDFIIKIDTSLIKADKIMYSSKGDNLNIVVTPKKGQFNKNMISFSEGNFNVDAIIVLDSPDLDRIGDFYEKNAKMFFEIPVINIDHHAGNDHFGKINLVDLTATSTAEILVSVIEALTGDPKFFDENIATALLTGIITDTNSFQNTNTTPKSLTVAAQLVALGARQQEIIKKIYKTKLLSTLKLWGRALANIVDEKTYKFVWAEISNNDFSESGALTDESSGLIDELLKTVSGVDFALLLSEKESDLHGSLRSTTKSKDVSAIARIFGGGGHAMAAAFQLKNTNLEQSRKVIIEKIKKFQGEQISL